VTGRILIIDDDSSIANLERRHLERAGFEVFIASSGGEAFQRLSGDSLPDLLIIDMRLPDISGIDVMKRLKDHGLEVPSIIVTGGGDQQVAVSAMKLGARDYIVKDPEALRELPKTCSEVLRKSNLERENARLMEEIKKSNSDLVEANKRLGELSRRDDLTGLYNRRTLMELLARECAMALRYELPLSFALLDLDHFKAINDTYGHPVGDLVLRQFAEVLMGRLRRTDILGRFGGEEFGVVLTGTPLDKALYVCDEIRKLVSSSSFGEDSAQLKVTVSAGAALFTTGMDIDALIKTADNGLYKAKDEGRDRSATVQELSYGDSETKSPVER